MVGKVIKSTLYSNEINNEIAKNVLKFMTLSHPAVNTQIKSARFPHYTDFYIKLQYFFHHFIVFLHPTRVQLKLSQHEVAIQIHRIPFHVTSLHVWLLFIIIRKRQLIEDLK